MFTAGQMASELVGAPDRQVSSILSFSDSRYKQITPEFALKLNHFPANAMSDGKNKLRVELISIYKFRQVFSTAGEGGSARYALTRHSVTLELTHTH
jgi:hypothetical protein